MEQVKLYTVEEFEQLAAEPANRDRLLELIDGEIVEKVLTEEHGVIALNIGTEIKIYLKQNPIGRAGVEVNHRVLDDVYNSRVPDVSFIKDPRHDLVTKGSVPQMPDLAIEIKSP
jgi:Uma2 family endonuclease